jgi:hypothetical protein
LETGGINVEIILKWILMELSREGVDWIYLAQVTVHPRNIVLHLSDSIKGDNMYRRWTQWWKLKINFR